MAFRAKVGCFEAKVGFFRPKPRLVASTQPKVAGSTQLAGDPRVNFGNSGAHPMGPRGEFLKLQGARHGPQVPRVHLWSSGAHPMGPGVNS